MIDANSKFLAILTDVGAAKLANANVLGVPWNITQMGLGDANGADPQPGPKQTKLINEWRRRPLNQLMIDPVNPAVIIAEQVIPADEGGYWIREVGLYDADGDLVAVANCAPSFKPILSQGSGRTQVVRMNLIVSSTAQITLKIDPAVVLATREFVDSRILEELSKLDIKQSVRAATTGNIALVGLQVVDGVSLNAGDRVLVKNQAAAKDNGPYVVANGAWVRAKDADNNVKLTPNLTVAVEVGATQADTIWQLVTDGPIVVGATALTFKDITDGLARLFSPSFAGNPTAPTPSRFDSSKSVATTEFLKQRGVEFSGFTTNTVSLVLTAAHVGGLHSFADAGQLMATLPPTAGVANAATITLACAGAGGLKVVASGADLVSTATGIAGPLVLALGDTAEFIRLQDQWLLVGGTVALRFAGTMTGPNFVTQPKFDNGKALATTEFAQRAQGSYADSVAYSGNTTLTAADVGRLVAIGGTSATVTLPDATTVPLGAVITLLASTTVGLTIRAQTGQSVASLSSVNGPLSVAPSTMSVLRRLNDGTGWVLEDGDAALKYSPLFSSQQLANGYQKLPSGLIIQWIFTTTLGSQGALSVWPIAFPNACLFAAVTCSNGESPAMVSIGARSKSQVGAFASALPVSIGFIGIGY
ncbi:phage tail protein [Pseudomonas sp. GM80]|uniref:phage tail protein n=1 Tax=Pseudomonas sp. GM80 TaxID=1144339 RepID=UPI00026F8CF1|nr:phage tail protein [Pseudomonas sp. GM80]EJN18668.1 hypothetical protein PMI37_05698 [Pseudomonas sp. GM80]